MDSVSSETDDSDSLSERTQTLNNLDESILNETTSSSNDAAVTFDVWAQKQKNNQKLRGSRIAEKEAEKKEIVDSIREHKEEQSQNQQLKTIQNMMIMKMMQKTMNMLESPEDETQSPGKNNQIILRIDEIEEKIKSLNNNVQLLCNLLDK